MSARELAKQLVDTLPVGNAGLFNPWKESLADDEPINTPQAKLERLAAHLDCRPRFILCGEAPGYQGCARSGVAFTSERLLLEGAIPRIPALSQRLTSRRLPFSEPSATIVWKALYQVGIADVTLLWNAVQLHPFNVGDHLTNRTPKNHELVLGAPAMKLLSVAFPEAKIVAVGNKARDLIESMGIRTAGAVRHPARGGATEFTSGLAELAGK